MATLHSEASLTPLQSSRRGVNYAEHKANERPSTEPACDSPPSPRSLEAQTLQCLSTKLASLEAQTLQCLSTKLASLEAQTFGSVSTKPASLEAQSVEAQLVEAVLTEPVLPDGSWTERTSESQRHARPTPWSPVAGSPSPSQALSELSDGELLAQLATLVKHERGLTVSVLVHLAEVERRELHLAKGCSSLFAYCVQRLGLSEDIAYKRVGAARYGRRFPLALQLLTEGALHLSALMLVGPHLTEANHREWLTAAAGKTKREVEHLVATRCPKPDVASSIRKLPTRHTGAQPQFNDDVTATPSRRVEAPPKQTVDPCTRGSGPSRERIPFGHMDTTQSGVEQPPQADSANDTGASSATRECTVDPASTASSRERERAANSAPVESPREREHAANSASVESSREREHAANSASAVGLSQLHRAARPSSAGNGCEMPHVAARSTSADEGPSSSSSAKVTDRPRVQPLSGSSYRIVFTASEAIKRKLDRARELCSHCVKPGDLPALFERALDLLIEREEKRRYALRSVHGKRTRCARETKRARLPVPHGDQVAESAAPTQPETQRPVSASSSKTNERVAQPSMSMDAEQALQRSNSIEAEMQPDLRTFGEEPDPVRSVQRETQAPVPVTSAKTAKRTQAKTPADAEIQPYRRASAKLGPIRPNPPWVKETSRYVPAVVSRTVSERDEGQCTFVDDEGNRCTARHFLEIDHIEPYGRGGQTTTANCRTLCRAHNQYLAKLAYGTEFMNRARARPRAG